MNFNREIAEIDSKGNSSLMSCIYAYETATKARRADILLCFKLLLSGVSNISHIDSLGTVKNKSSRFRK